jgi:hypothetical protein
MDVVGDTADDHPGTRQVAYDRRQVAMDLGPNRLHEPRIAVLGAEHQMR